MSNSPSNPSPDDRSEKSVPDETIRFSTAIPDEYLSASTKDANSPTDPYKTDLFKTKDPLPSNHPIPSNQETLLPNEVSGISTLFPDEVTHHELASTPEDISKTIHPRDLTSPEIRRSQITESRLLVPTRRLHREQEPIQDLPADYQLVDILGQGGMGTVFLARQVSLDRLVALKVVKPIDGDHARRLAGEGKLEQATKHRRDQFLAEAVVTGDLDHPNIVPIHDLARTENDTLFYAMKKVEGIAWSKVIRKKTLQENLEILLKVCDAIGFAHSRGIVHRDIKPENVMLGDYGVVLLMDWGLAVSKPSYSKRGTIYQSTTLGGSPAYMAPEMAKGPVELIGPASDIYLLGATLYEILVGRAPHTGRNVSDCLRNVSNNEILEAPQHLREHELLQVALKAMATEVVDRFPNVEALQEAIREYRAHAESLLLSHRANDVWQLAKESKGYAEYARALFGFEESLKLWPENINAFAKAAQVRLDYADLAYQNADYDLGISLLDQTVAAHQPLIRKLREAQVDREQRTARMRQMRRVAAALLAFIFIGGALALYLIRQERDAAILAKQNETASRVVAENNRKLADDAKVQALQKQAEAETAREIANDEREKAMESEANARRSAREASYESYVAKVGLAKARVDQNEFEGARAILEQIQQDPNLQSHIGWEWHWLSRQTNLSRSSISLATPPKQFSLSSTRDRGLLIDIQGRVYPFHLADDSEIQISPVCLATTGAVVSAVSTDATRYALGLESGEIRIVDAQSGRTETECIGHRGTISALQFLNDHLLVSASADRSLRIWDISTGKELATGWHLLPVIAFTAVERDESATILCATSDSRSGVIVVWRYQHFALEPMANFKEHDAPVTAVALSSDGTTAASGDRKGQILVWQPDALRSSSPTAQLTSALKRIREQAPTESMKQTSVARPLHAPAQSEQLQLTPTDRSAKESAHRDAITSLCFVPSSRVLISTSADYVTHLWDTEAQNRLDSLRGHGAKVFCAIPLSQNSNQVLTASEDGTLKLWNTRQLSASHISKSTEPDTATRLNEEIFSVRFDPTEEYALTACRDHMARIVALDKRSQKLEAPTMNTTLTVQDFMEGTPYGIWSMVVDAPRNRLFVTTADGMLRSWNLNTGMQLSAVQGIGFSAALALSPQGDMIVTGSSNPNNKALVWRVSPEGIVSDAPLYPIRTHATPVTTACFSTDGQTIFTADAQGQGLLWNGQTGESLGAPLLIHQGSRINAAQFHPTKPHLFLVSDDNNMSETEVPSGKLLRLYPHTGVVTHLSLSKSGDQIATLSQISMGSQIESHVRVWDHASQESRLLLKASTKPETVSEDTPPSDASSLLGRFVDLQFAPADDRLGIIHTHRNASSLRIFEIRRDETPIEMPSLQFPSVLSAASGIRWQSSEIILSSHGNAAFLWHLPSLRMQRSFRPHASLTEAAFSGDGNWIATGSGSIRIWDRKTGKGVAKVEIPHAQRVESLDFIPSSDRYELASCGPDGVVRIWVWNPQSLTVSLKREVALTPQTALHQVSFDSTGKKLVAVGDEGRGWILEVDEATPPVIFADATNPSSQYCVAFSPDGKWIITGGEDRIARLWSFSGHVGGELQLKAYCKGHAERINDVDFLGDMNQSWRIVTASEDKSVRVWDALQVNPTNLAEAALPVIGRELLSLRRHSLGVTSLDVARDRQRIICASRDGTLVIDD